MKIVLSGYGKMGKMLEQMVGALNEGVAYNKKNVSMEMKALCQIRK